MKRVHGMSGTTKAFAGILAALLCVPVLTFSGSAGQVVQAASNKMAGSSTVTTDNASTKLTVIPISADAGMKETGTSVSGSDQMPGMANPFTDYKTQAEAEKAAGFALPFPALAPERYSRRVYRAIPGELLEIICYDKDGNDYRIREGAVRVQALDTDSSADISGDYNTYSDVQKWQVGPITVTEKGQNGKTYDFITSLGGYAFSVTSRDGLSKEEVKALRKEFIEQYFPAVLEGQTRETVKAFLNPSFTLSYESRMTDGIMIYMDPGDKDYFLLISFGADAKAVSCSYQYNEIYTIDADGAQ
jgi:hypothetical protein